MEIIDTDEGRLLIVSLVFVTAREAIQQVHQLKGNTMINQINVNRLDIDAHLILFLSRLVKTDGRSWRSLTLNDCTVGALDAMQENKFLDVLSRFASLFLHSSTYQETPNATTSPYYILPLRGASRVSTLGLCVNNMDDSLVQLLVPCLSSTTNCRVSRLHLASRRGAFQAAILAEAFRGNISLENLELEIGDWELPNHDDLFLLLSALCGHSRLKQLNIQDMDLSDRTLQALGDMMLHPDSRLEEVNLKYPKMPLNVSVLAPAIAQNPPSFKELDISFCELVDTEVLPLIDALTRNTHMETLDLSYNSGLTETLLIYLGDRLPRIHLKALNVLDLHPSSPSPAALQAISEGLEQNTHMKVLMLELGNDLGCAQRIQFHLNLNRGGRRALDEKIPLALWPLVLERAQRCNHSYPVFYPTSATIDSTYYLLRHEPALWQRSHGAKTKARLPVVHRIIQWLCGNKLLIKYSQ
jgi:hypothetical protein